MATKRASDSSKPARKRPDFTGTRGELVSLEGLTLEFGKSGRVSPYDALLDQLATAKGQVLRFDDVKAKASVQLRAKKKKYKVSFAEAGGKLFVRFDGSEEEDIRQARRDAILQALKSGALTVMKLVSAIRNTGDVTIDAQTVEVITAQMVRGGQIIGQDGGTFRLPLKTS